MIPARPTPRLLALASIALIATPALAQTRSKAPRAQPTRPAALDHQRLIRPNRGPIPRQLSQEPRTLEARQQQIRDVRRLTSPALPGVGAAGANNPRDRLFQTINAIRQRADEAAYINQAGSLDDANPEILGTSQATVVTMTGARIPLNIQYSKIYSAGPDQLPNRSLTIRNLGLVSVGAVSKTAVTARGVKFSPTKQTALFNETAARFAEQGFSPVIVAPGQYRFVKADNPAALSIPRCHLVTSIPTVANESVGRWLPTEQPYRRSSEGSFTPALEFSNEMLALSGATPLNGSQASPTMAPASPISIEDAAIAALGRGKTDLAIDLLQAHIAENPDDASSVRLLGVARLLEGEIAAGIRLVDQAYLAQPDLADLPLGMHAFPGDRRGCRKALREVVKLAHVLDDPRAWLTAAVLMQVEDRTTPARRMIARARAAGIEVQIADAFESALR